MNVYDIISASQRRVNHKIALGSMVKIFSGGAAVETWLD
jgi:hypothetical protein